MIQVACVGCGEAMARHLGCLAASGRVSLVGHCDVDVERAEAAAAQYGGEVFSCPVEMYDKLRPDAVYVAVPPYAHGAIEEEAAKRGIALFVEGPIALERAMAKRIASTIRKAGIVTSVGYCYRYSDTATLARKLLRGKAVSVVQGSWMGGLPETSWRRRADQSGGQLVEQTTHVLDLVRYLCGEVHEVHAFASRGCLSTVADLDVDESSVVAMRLKNGAAASITSSCVAGHQQRVYLEVMTPEMVLHLNNGCLRVTEEDKSTEYRARSSMYELEMTAFLNSVQAGKRGGVRSTYADGVKSLLVSCAANESIASGMSVRP